MRKTFLNGQCLLLCLGLLAASGTSLAAYSDDADCRAVSDSARAGVNRVVESIDTAAVRTGAAVERAKSCVDTVIGEANRAVPNFGGAIGGAISKFAADLLARQSCRIISSAQSQVNSQVRQVTGQAEQVLNQGISQVPGAVRPLIGQAAGAATPPADAPTIWSRLANLF